MKNKVFYIGIISVGLMEPLLSQAQVLKSDLTLLKGLPPLSAEEYVDPYWDLAWHGKVASYGDPDSQFLVAQIYEQGKLVPKDIKKALEFYTKAAEQDHIESCMRLGKLYSDSRRQSTFNLKSSKKWYQRAAEKGYVQAQLQLSQVAEKDQLYDQAIYWMEKAMTQMFPNVSDLTTVSPDLERLKKLRENQK